MLEDDPYFAGLRLLLDSLPFLFPFAYFALSFFVGSHLLLVFVPFGLVRAMCTLSFFFAAAPFSESLAHLLFFLCLASSHLTLVFFLGEGPLSKSLLVLAVKLCLLLLKGLQLGLLCGL